MNTEKLKGNVSTEANETFVRGLHATDPKRFASLAKVDPTARRIAPTPSGWHVGVCAGCDSAIVGAPFIERGKHAGEGREFCSRACRDGKVVTIPAPLLERKYATVGERQEARKAQDRARKASLSLEKAA